MSLFTVQDIDTIFLSILSIDNLTKLAKVSKYYYVKTAQYLQKYHQFCAYSKNAYMEDIFIKLIALCDYDIYIYVIDKLLCNRYHIHYDSINNLMIYLENNHIVPIEVGSLSYMINCKHNHALFKIFKHFISNYNKKMDNMWIDGEYVVWCYAM